ncbi:MAG: helix-turn-helix domain-containing protein [Caulobacteraceae bacterium]
MKAIATGRIVLWEGGSLWVFHVPPGGARPPSTEIHAHRAFQVTLALDGVFELTAAGCSAGGPAAVVAPDESHAFKAEGSVALLFVEPESAQGRALRALTGGKPLSKVACDHLEGPRARILAALRTNAPTSELRDAGRDMIARLVGEADAAATDPRVERIVAWASAELEGPIGIADAAELVSLSPCRMSHLFVEQTGLPFRTYVLWLRLMKAVEAFAAGESLTTAAHEAGFSDSAHLSRTFKRMFGVTAAALELT